MWLWKYTCTSFSKNRVPVPDKAYILIYIAIGIYIYTGSINGGIWPIPKYIEFGVSYFYEIYYLLQSYNCKKKQSKICEFNIQLL